MPKEISPNELTKIVRKAQEGSRAHYETLYGLYSKPIFNFIWRLIGSVDEAEDLTQDTFLKAHRELGQLREPGQFKYWLYRIARNEVYQKLRRSQKIGLVSLDNEETSLQSFLPDPSSEQDPERQVLSQELDEIVSQSLAQMSSKYRDVFVLAVFQKMSYEDITKVVGRSLLSVKTDIYRARLAIKKDLERYLNRA